MKSNSIRLKKSRLSWSIAAVIAMTTGTGVGNLALAQDESLELEEITITGSRITRRDLESSSPIVTVDNDFLSNTSQTTVDEALKRLPQFAASSGQTSQARAFGDTGLATLNLRNLGSNRNLVLVDGRRMQPASSDFSVDVNTIPAALIQNVEVITGGASAAYGSDAISGVINFKLRNDFEGLEVSAKTGQSERGDYKTKELNLLAGTNMADGRGNIVFALNYSDRGRVERNDIEFFQNGYEAAVGGNGFLTTGYYQAERPNPADPAVIAAALGGVGVAGESIGFNTDNTTLFGVTSALNYNSGLYPDNPRTSLNPDSGEGLRNNNFSYDYSVTPLERYSVFAKANLELTENTEFYMQGSYSHYTINSIQFPSVLANFWSTTIPRDGNHYTNAAFESILESRPNPSAPWNLHQTAAFAGPVTNTNTNQNFQALVGLKGDIAGTEMSWNAYASHGQTDVGVVYRGGISTSAYRNVIAQPNFGLGYSDDVGTCTSGLSPFSPADAVSADCLDMITLTPKNQTTQEQDIVEVNLQGNLFSLPAGDVLFAVGAGYRKNTYQQDVADGLQTDPAICSICTNIGPFFGAASTIGSTDVSELYGELVIPLLNDLPLIDSLEMGLGYRFSDYDTIGGADTYKADFSWTLNDSLRLRGGYQRAVRAPNPTELFSGAQAVLGFSFTQQCVNAGPFAADAAGNNPANPNQLQVQQLCAALTPGATVNDYNFVNGPHLGSLTPFALGTAAGNSNLEAEVADSYTFGGVYRPTGDLWLESSVSVSLDYYIIELEDAIGILTPADVYNQCFNRDGATNPSYDPDYFRCQSISRLPISDGGYNQSVSTIYENQGGIKTEGIDLAINWNFPAGPGLMNFVWQASYLQDFERALLPGDEYVEYAGYGNNFDVRSLLTTGYAWNSIDIGVRWKYLSQAKDSSCAGFTICTVDDTDAYSIFDFFSNYHVNDNFRLNFGIDNLLNEDPPIVAGQLGNTNAGEYDVIGRNYYVGIRASF